MWSLYDHSKLSTIKPKSVDTQNSDCWESDENHFYLTLESSAIFIHSCVHSVDLLRFCSVPGSGNAKMSKTQNFEGLIR